MVQIFPYANIVAGVLVLIVGFGFHWIGQLFSVLDWERATRIGLQEKTLLPEYKVYEHGIAVADVTIGWIYGIAGLGLILNAEWGYRLAWIPGSILIYHGISAWVWEGNRRSKRPSDLEQCDENWLVCGEPSCRGHGHSGCLDWLTCRSRRRR